MVAPSGNMEQKLAMLYRMVFIENNGPPLLHDCNVIKRVREANKVLQGCSNKSCREEVLMPIELT